MADSCHSENRVAIGQISTDTTENDIPIKDDTVAEN